MAKQGKPTGHYTQAARLHTVIRLIESRNGINLEELVEETGVDLRTVHRDLAAIQEAGYPLTSRREDGRMLYSFMTSSRQIQPVTFTLEELVSLHLLKACAGLLPSEPFGAEIENIFSKIHSALPPRSVAHLERIARVSLPRFQGTRTYSGSLKLLSELRRALLYQFTVKISYNRSGKEHGIYELDPYTLVLAKGGIYLLAFAKNRNAIRLFAIERISELTVTKRRFEISPGFTPENHFSDAFALVTDKTMQIKIRFDNEVAHLIRDRFWKKDQKVINEPDGSVTLYFEAAGTLEIMAWVLSYGKHAELLEPPELRKELRQQIKGLREIYRKKGKD